MSSKNNPNQVSGQSDDNCATFYFGFQKGDVGHTLHIGPTRQGKCTPGFAVIAANNEVATTFCPPTAGIRGESK